MDYDSEWLETDMYFDQVINHNYDQFYEGSFLARTDQASSRFDDLSWITPQMNDSIIPIANQGQAPNNVADSYENLPIDMEQEEHQQVTATLRPELDTKMIFHLKPTLSDPEYVPQIDVTFRSDSPRRMTEYRGRVHEEGSDMILAEEPNNHLVLEPEDRHIDLLNLRSSLPRPKETHRAVVSRKNGIRSLCSSESKISKPASRKNLDHSRELSRLLIDTTGGSSMETKKKVTNRKSCYNCRLLKVGCSLTDRQYQFVQPCTGCQTRKHKTTIIQNPVQYLSLKTVYTADLEFVLEKLVYLRTEISQNLSPHETRLFCGIKSPIICHMQFHMDEEEEDIMTHFSDSIHPVAVTRLSTTVEALETARSLGTEACPLKLDVTQMNSVMDWHLKKKFGKEIFSFRYGIIRTALRCSFWLAVLFNWNKNAVYKSQQIGILATKNLVLETIYAIEHEIKKCFEQLQSEGEDSLANSSDPEAVACALSLIHSCSHTQEKVKKQRSWNAGSLVHLDKYLENFHERNEAAWKALQRARRMHRTFDCQVGSHQIQDRIALMEEQSKLLPVMSWTYEKCNLASPLGNGDVTRSKTYSYTQILEASTEDPNFMTLDRDVLSELNKESYENQELESIAVSSNHVPTPGTGPFASNPYYMPVVLAGLPLVNPQDSHFYSLEQSGAYDWFEMDPYQMGPVNGGHQETADGLLDMDDELSQLQTTCYLSQESYMTDPLHLKGLPFLVGEPVGNYPYDFPNQFGIQE